MTFIENNNLLSFSLSSKDKIKGFKCTESHDKKKFLKFRYFCVDCLKNICSECVVYHTDLKGAKHNLIVLDFNKPTNYKQVKEINKIIYEKNKEENNNSDNNSTLNAQKILFSEEAQDKMNNIKTNKIIMPYGNTAKLIEGENDDFDYFTEFISIIINDFLYFPNYFHSYNIENIYRFFMNQNNFGAKIKYLNKSNQDIQLFGSQFVRDNEKNFSIIINESIEDIKQFHKFDAKEALVEMYLTDKIKKNRRHKIEKIKNMFQDCESLIEVEFNFNGYERSKDLSYLFDGCKSLIKVPECIINWVKNNCDDISYIFSNCYSLKELPDISQWKTSNVNEGSILWL